MKMPFLFIGHGSPMIALEKSPLTEKMRELGKALPTPKAILAISAHWYLGGQYIQSDPKPRQIYDMGGFPRELYELKYAVKGSAELSSRVEELLGDEVAVNNDWGIDHGSWTVLTHLYPEANIPVVQLSVDLRKTPENAVELGSLLKPLREEGYLLLGSGNIVHNLRRIHWNLLGGTTEADEFDAWFKSKVEADDLGSLLDYKSHPSATYAVPTPDHLLPFFYIYGLREKDEKLEVFNEERTLGAISMTSYLFG